MTKKAWFGVSLLGLIGLGCAGAVTGIAMSESNKDNPTPIVVDQPSPRAAVGTSQSPWVADGDWLVGTDIKPGTYKSPGATEGFCAWVVRASDDQNAEVVAVGSADKSNQPQRAVVKKGQLFQTNGCRGWVKQ